MKTRFTLASLSGLFMGFALMMLAGSSQVNAQSIRFGIGSTITPSAYSYPSPYGNDFHSSKQQYLIRANEFDSAGVSGAIWLNSIAFFDSLEAMETHANFSIRMKLTQQSELQWWEHGLTEVYNSGTFTDVHGWNTHNFSQPFFYDGQSNVVVEICYNNTTNKSIGQVLLTDTFNYIATKLLADNYYGICNDTTYSYNYYSRPDMIFGTSPLYSLDAGMIEPDYGFFVMNSNSVPLDLAFRNFGSTTITTANLVYQLNAGTPVTYNWLGSVASGQTTASFLAGTITLPTGFSTLKMWTSSPNGGVDQYSSNDTTQVRFFYTPSPLSGTYEIGDSASDFPTFHDAVKALLVAGINGDVVFEVETGVYDEKVKISPVAGTGPSASVTFRSEILDRDSVILQSTASWTNWNDYNYTLCLDGADYIHFEDMSIRRYGAEYYDAAPYTRAVELRQGADHNRFIDIYFKAPPTYSQNWGDNTLVLLNPYDANSNNSDPSSYNTFENSLFEYGASGIIAESYSYNGTDNVIRGNHFAQNLSMGIHTNQYERTFIESNLIEHDNSSSYQWFYGIYLYNAPFTRVEKNRVYSKNNGSQVGIYTYYLTGSNSERCSIINNMVSLYSYNGSSVDGIYTEYDTYLDIFHNSVRIDGMQNYGAAFRDYRSSFTRSHNNIFLCVSGDYAMNIYNNTGSFVSDFNNLYTNGSNYVYFNNGFSTLPAYQVGMGQDINSIMDSTAFVAINDLHIDTSHVSAQVINAIGKPNLTTVDLDYEVRSVMPDLGADEFITSGFDGALTWLSPQVPTTGGNQNIVLLLQNNRTTTITSASISYGDGGSPITQSWSSLSIAAGGADTLTFSTTYNLSSAVQLRAYINTLNGISDQIQTNDTTAWQSLCPAMSGTYTINSALPTSGTNYQTFNAAVQALECGGVTGPVAFNVYSGTYNEQVVIHSIIGASGTNSITFNGLSGDSSMAILSFPASDTYMDSNFTLLLDGARHTYWQYLTIKRSGSVFDYSKVIELRNMADSNSFSHCHIEAPAATYSNWEETALIYFSPENSGGGGGGGSFAPPASGGVGASVPGPSSYNTFSNNYLKNGGISILAENYNYDPGTGNSFIRNVFYEPYEYACYVEDYTAWVFRENTLSKHGNGESFYGFDFNSVQGDLDFSYNNLIIKNVYYGYGLNLDNVNTGYYGFVTVHNNSISIESQYYYYAFYFYNVRYGSVLHNSIRANTTYSSGGWSPGNTLYAYYLYDMELKNNLFSQIAGEYVLNINNSSIDLDFNGYFHPATSLFYSNSTGYSGLSNWQQGTGWDDYSVFDTIPYVSDTNLHINTSNAHARTFSSAGTQVNLANDIDFESRPSRPDMGSDEFSLSGLDARIEWLSPTGNQPAGNLDVEVILVNVASNTVNSANLSYTDGTTTVSQAFSSLAINQGEADTLWFTVPFNFSTSTALRAYINSINSIQDDYQPNDTTGWNKLCRPMAGTYTINAALPASSSNFQSFSEAVDALNCGGVSAPVTFEVAAGTYNESITIQNVPGMADTNLISFIHNGDSSLAVLAYTPVGSNYATLQFGNGANHVYFKGITIKTNALYYESGIAVVLRDNVSSLTFENCALLATPTDYTSDAMGFSANNSGCSDITIRNSRIYGGYYGIRANNIYTLTIEGCRIEDFGYMGIYSQYCNNNSIEQCYIDGGSTINTYKYCMYLYGPSGPFQVLNNQIINRNYGYGIYLYDYYPSYSDSGNIINNMVSFSNLNSNTQYGIQVYYSNSLNILNNSVQLRTTYANNRALYLYYTYNSKIFNNILACVPSGYALYQAGSPSGLQLDYNSYYSTSTLAYYNYSNASNLTSLRTLTGGDLNSISQAPSFMADTNLHIDQFGSTAGFFNNSAMPLSLVPNDIDGDLRNPVNPDMGADEFILTGMDASITWIAPVMPVSAGAQMVKVSISNLRPTPITSLHLRYTDGLNTVSEYFSGFTLNQGEVDTFTFTTTYLLDLNATLLAYIDSVNGGSDDLQTNDTTATVVICTALSGTYTLNPSNPTGGSNFNSFTDVKNHLACAGVSGPVIFDIASGTYNEQLTFVSVNGASSTNTITFRSQSGDSSSVIITFAAISSGANWTLCLDGADYFRFEKISLIATGASYGTVVDLRNNAYYNSFTSCLVRTGTTTSGNFRGIYLNSGSNFTEIANCNIDNGYYGIYMDYSNNDCNIVGNTIDSAQSYGIYSYYSSRLKIERNYISSRAGFNSSHFGIYLSEMPGLYRIFNNQLVSRTTNTSYGIYVEDGNYSGSDGRIYNNMVSNTTSSSNTKYGIRVYYCNWVEILNNSVSLLSTSSSNMGISTYYGNGIDIQNNAVNLPSSGRAFYNESSTNVDFRNNSLYASSGNLIYWSGTNYTSLTSFQSATGQGSQCFVVQAPFISFTDLHIDTSSVNAGLLNGAAIPIGYVTNDFDNESRTATPDIGADEFLLQGLDARISWYAPIYLPTIGNAFVSVIVSNTMDNVITSITLSYTDGSSINTEGFIGLNLLAGQSDTLTFQAGYTFTGLTSMRAYIESVNSTQDEVRPNDTTTWTQVCIPLSGVYTLDPTSPTDGSNFNSWKDLAKALECAGLVGPTTVNVANGTYTSKFSLNVVPGLSSTNTLTIQSDGLEASLVTLQYNGVSNDYNTVALANVGYINFRFLTIAGLNSSYAYAVFLNNTDSIKFESCNITVPLSSSSYVVPVSASTGANDYLTLMNNQISGGYYSTYIYNSNYTQINGNSVSNFYYYGLFMYSCYDFSIIGNTIQNTPTVSTNSYCIYTESGARGTFLKNKILMSSNYTNTNFGMYIYSLSGSLGSRSLIANNFITSTRLSGADYLIYAYNAYYLDVANNSLYSSSASTDNQGVYIYYCYYYNVNNNSIYFPNGGTPLYFYSGSTPVSNYNNLITTGATTVNYNGTSYPTLASWQASAAGRDPNSISVNPLYLSGTDLHSVSSDLDSAGTPLAYIVDDIDGDPRNASFPDIGADEFTPPVDQVDVFPTNLSATITDCFGKDTIYFGIAGIGTDSVNYEVSSRFFANVVDDFDPAYDPAIWQSFSSSGVSSLCGSYSGANALRFDGGSTRIAQTKPLELSNGGIVEFYVKRGSGGNCETPDGGEDLNLEYSVNGGSSWVNIMTYPNYLYSGFTKVTHILPGAAETSTTLLRLVQYYHSGSGYDNWAIDDFSISTSSPAVTIVPDSGMVQPGDTVWVSAAFDLTGVNVNDITDFIINVATSDPRNPLFTINVDVNYSGDPLMSPQQDSLNYGIVYVGDSDTLMLDILNPGCDTLWVSNVLSTNAVYSPEQTNFFVMPGAVKNLPVRFTPIASGLVNAQLTVYSDAGDSIVYLTGTGEAPPVALFMPDSAVASITCETKDTVLMWVKNGGLDPLTWSFSNVDVLGGIPFLSAIPKSGSVLPNDSVEVTLYFSRHNNLAGVYRDTIRISTNDPLRPLFKYPVVFNMAENYKPIFLGNDTTVCAGAGVTLNAGPGYSSYLWSNAANTQTIFVNTNGIYSVTATEGNCTYIDSMQVTVLPFLSVDAGVDTSHCPGVWVGLLATTTGGSGNFNFVWSPTTGLNNSGIANPSANPSTNITYTVNVTDAVGCIATDQVVVETNPVIEVNPSSNSPICYGDSVELLATPIGGTSPFYYNWSPAGNMNNNSLQAPKAKPLSSTWYYVTVTDSKGCSDNYWTLVDVKRPYVNAVATPSTICLGDSSRLIASSSQGTAPYSYAWSPTADLSDPTNDTTYANPLINTVYTVTVTDDMGCTNTDNVTVSISNLTLSITADDTICEGSSKNLTVTPSSGWPYTYVWSPVAGLNNAAIQNPVATPTAETVYHVTVTNTYGCEKTDSVHLWLIPSPTANAGPNDTICFGGSTQLSGSGSGGGSTTYTYEWSNYYTSNRFISNPVVNPYSSYTYTLTVTAPNGCEATDQVYVHVYPSISVDAGSYKYILQGDSVTLTASVSGGVSPYSYAWSPNDSINDSTLLQPLVWPNVSTQYTLHVTDIKGCTKSDYTWVNVTPVYNLSGTVRYLNANGAALDSVTIYKRNTSSHDTIDSKMTDDLGLYSFPRTPAGWVEIRASSEQPWNGVNATDALRVRRHIVFLEPLTSAPLTAADVNASSSISSLDALQILRRTIGNITSFSAGDWAFYEQKDIYMPGNNYTYNLYGLCMGDVNGSNPAPGDRLKPTVHLANQGVLYLDEEQVIEVPIYVDQDINLGAVTLVLDYPEGSMEVVNVKSGLKDLLFNDLDGQLRIAWEDVDGKDLNRGSVLLTLEIRLLNPDLATLPFKAGIESEFADKQADVYSDVKLFMPALRSGNTGAEVALSNYPNPFRGTTEIVYQIPEDGEVVLEVFNALGERIAVLDKQWRQAGTYSVEFLAASLAAGVYSYRLTLQGVENDSVVTKTMVITK